MSGEFLNVLNENYTKMMNSSVYDKHWCSQSSRITLTQKFLQTNISRPYYAFWEALWAPQRGVWHSPINIIWDNIIGRFTSWDLELIFRLPVCDIISTITLPLQQNNILIVFCTNLMTSLGMNRMGLTIYAPCSYMIMITFHDFSNEIWRLRLWRFFVCALIYYWV